MRVFSWNCRGLGRPRTVCALVDAIREFRPQVVCLIETKKKASDWNFLKLKFGFRYCFAVDCKDKAGGLAVLWLEELDLTIRSYSIGHVDADVRYGCYFRLTLFYGDLVAAKRKFSWELFRMLSTASNLPWIVLGDFNEVLGDNEVLGVRPRQLWQMSNFREALEDCDLSDLGFKGYPFTFTNGRLLLLDMEGSECKRKTKSFRFQAMWMDHPSFGKLMGEFWNDRRKIKDLKTQLKEVKDQKRDETSRIEEARLSEELDYWLAREETLWLKRSRVIWLNQGDRNTKFFHARASLRKKKNWISELKDEGGNSISEQPGLVNMASDYFKKIFQSSLDGRTVDWNSVLEHVGLVVNEEMNAVLNRDITKEEVRRAVFAQGPPKAPGLDGFPGIFYQKHWAFIKNMIISYVR
ncbi:hypothetical protein QQ045_029152 [Rhodiola kirilowii]